MNQSSHSPPLPNLQGLSISPYPPSNTDYRYNGVFAPPLQPAPPTWGSPTPGKRGSRSGLPNGWLDSARRDSPPAQFDYYRQGASSPPALSPPSSTTSGPTSSSHPFYHPQHQQQSSYPIDPNSFSSMGVAPSPPPMGYGMNTAGSAPNLAGFNPGGMPNYGSQSLAALNPRQWRTTYGAQPLDDDVIPTAIVIKNIPFAVSRETLLSVIESLGAPLPYAFNYHHDNGIFRGLAFANFRAPEEAAGVVAALNGYDVQGRKLRVEYKKVLQAGEKERIERDKAIKRMRSIQFDKEIMPPPIIPPPTRNGRLSVDIDQQSPPHSASSVNSDSLPLSLDLNDPTALDIYSRVLVFQQDRMRDELAFAKSLTPVERRIVHLVAQKLGLTSITSGEGDVKYVVVTRDAPARPSLTSSTSATISSSSYLSPYSSAPSDLSPSLRIKKSMPDLRGFNGPVVSRDPARSLTPQRSSGNLRSDGNREYVSMGASAGRRLNGAGSSGFNNFFGAPMGNIPPVPPIPSNLNIHSHSHSFSQPSNPVRAQTVPNGLGNGTLPSGAGGMNGNGTSTISTSPDPTDSIAQPPTSTQPLRNPRGPTGESRGFGGTLRSSASGILRGSNGVSGGMGIDRRVSEEDEDVGGLIEGMRTRESLEL